MRRHYFDPYRADKDRAAHLRGLERKKLHEMGSSTPFKDPEAKLRGKIRTNQTTRAKTRPVTLPKLSF